MSATNNNIEQHGPYKDLGEQQYNTLYKTLDVPLVDIRKKYYGRFMLLSLLLLLLTILFASFVKIPHYLQVPIVMENTVKDHVVIFNHSARVKQYFVTAGAEVKEGQEICQISSPEIQSLIATIRSAENKVKALEDYDSKNVDIQIKNIRTQAQIKNKNLTAIDAEKKAALALYHSKRQALDSEIAYAKTIRDKNKLLYEDGIISQFDYLEIEKKYIDKLNDLSILEKTQIQNTQEFDLKEQAIREMLVMYSIQENELESNYESDELKFADQIDLAKNNLYLSYGKYKLDDNGLILLAPMDGKMTYCYPDKALLQTGEILYRLEEEKGAFESNGYLNARDIGYVKSEMKARIMLETFPHYEWGSLTGNINEVSIAPNGEGQYAFTSTITDDNARISPLLQNGQTGVASIIIEEKSLFAYMKF